MLVECKNCGAPLDVNGVQRFLRCSYCDKVNRVRAMQTMAVETPPEWRPPPTWQPPPQFGPWQSHSLPFHAVSSPLANRLPLVIIGFVLVTGLGGIASFVASMRAGSATTPRAVEAPGASIVTLDLAALPRPDPPTVVGRGGRPVSGVTGRPQCVGYVATRPQIRLSTRDFAAFVVTPRSPDAVLLLEMATGQRSCSTEGAPALEGILPPGTHQLWVGVRQDGASPSVTLDVRAATQRLRPSATPLFAALSDRHGSDITRIVERSATVEGTVDISALDGDCRGFVSPAPQLTFDLMEFRGVAFAFEQHTDDLVLMIRTAEGHFTCESVMGGDPSAFAFDLPRGGSAVWVGVTDLTANGQYSLATRAAD